MKRLSRWVASLFGIGYSPIAPGTLGCAVAWVVLWFLPPVTGLWVWVGLPVVFLIGVWASFGVERQLGHDASPIIIDEAVSMWLVLALLPKSLLIWGIGFLLLRVFDIWKPFPANAAQEFRGGWGVMLDDIFAAVYTVIVMRIGLLLFG
jgi:phosphatidylglycerophosphatase A